MKPAACPQCAACAEAINAINGRYCLRLRRYIQHQPQPLCKKEPLKPNL